MAYLNDVKQTTYTSSNTWTPDKRMKFAKIYIWNGGGGGGSGRDGVSGASGGGAGGSAGFFSIYEILASNLQNTSYAVTIGAGGGGGPTVNGVTTNGNNGSDGGVSSLGAIVGISSYATLTNKGGGGVAGSSTAGHGYAFTISSLRASTDNAGALGNTTNGTAANGDNFAWGTGGAGAPGYASTVARAGQAGGPIYSGDYSTVLIAGGLAGSNSGGGGGNGNPATAFELFIGGTGGGSGGHDGVTTAGSGGTGGIPSGGGGGGAGNLSSNNSGAGGDGGRGQIIIVEFF